jgi:molybdate transport system substrate-binding protein
MGTMRMAVFGTRLPARASGILALFVALQAALSVTAQPLGAAEIRVLSGSAMEPVLMELVPIFQRTTNHKITISYAPTAPIIKKRLKGGETADVVIATAKGIADLASEGRVEKGSKSDIARVNVGAFVGKGVPKPDISSMDTFRQTLLSAKSIMHSDPARGGRTARYMSKLLGELDIASEIKPKIKIFAPGEFGKPLGEGGIGFALSTEIKARPGVELVGTLPAEIGYHTDFAAGMISANKVTDASDAFIRFFKTPAAKRILLTKGFEPL